MTESPSSRRQAHLAEPSPLRFTLLGGMDPDQVYTPLRATGYRRAHVLLAYLLMEAKRTHRREMLAELLWGDLAAGAGRTRLRRMLFVLREAVGDGKAAQPLLHISRDTVGINPRRLVEVDARLLLDAPSRATDAASAARLAEAVALYRAPFLEGFDDLVDGTPLAEWLAHWRRVLHGVTVACAAELCQWHLSAGTAHTAVEAARRLGDMASDNEGHLRLVMNTLAAAGLAAEALERFESFRRLLHEHLGVPPEPATCALAAALRQGMAEALPTAAPAAGLERRPAAVISVQMICPRDTDPERVAELCELPLQRCRDLLGRHDGHVLANPAGGLLAWFGFPLAQEEAPRRALEAALALATEATHFSGVRLELGVHGGTLVTDGNRATPDISGQLANVAMRLHAPACHTEGGIVLASKPVWLLAEGYFEGVPAGRVALPSGASVAMFRVLRATPARHRLEAAVALTPFVARDTEQARLESLWRDACAGRGATLVVSGDAGIGKSRLVDEFRAGLVRRGAAVRLLRCDSRAQGSPFHPVVELLRRLLVDESGPEAVVRYAADLLPDRPDAPALLLQLLALPPNPDHPLPEITPAEGRRRTADLLLDILDRRSRGEPLLLLLEDVHWADPSTLELARRAAARAPEQHVLLVLTTRPGTPLPRSRRRIFHMALAPLSPVAVASIVAHVAPGLAPPLADRIRTLTGGVPLFVEEMARLLAGQPPAEGVPPSLQHLLMARLDKCHEARPLAQLAAVAGKSFPEALLRAAATLTPDEFTDQLLTLERHGLLVHDLDPGTWRFHHALLQEAAYASLARTPRQAAHRRVAECLLERFPEMLVSRPELAAYHLSECGETEQAIQWWQRAGQRTAQRSANAEAIAHYRKGLALVATLPAGLVRDRTELALRTALGLPLVSSQGYGAHTVQENYERAIELARMVRDEDMLLQSLLGLWQTSSSQEGYHASLALSGRIRLLAEQSNRSEHLLLAHYTQGNPLFCMGEFRAARAALETAVALGQHTAPGRLSADFGEDYQVSALGFLSWTLWFLGEEEQAWARSRESLALARQSNHPYSLAFALTFAIKLHWYAGKRPDDTLTDELLALGQRKGFAFWEATGMLLHGRRLAAAGDAQGVTILVSLLEVVHETMLGAEVFFLVALLESQVALGLFEAALDTAARCLASSERSGNRHYDAEVYRLRGEMLLCCSPPDAAGAEACFRQAAAIAEAQHAAPLLRRIRTRLAVK